MSAAIRFLAIIGSFPAINGSYERLSLQWGSAESSSECCTGGDSANSYAPNFALQTTSVKLDLICHWMEHPRSLFP